MFLEIPWPRRLSMKAGKAFCTKSLYSFFMKKEFIMIKSAFKIKKKTQGVELSFEKE